MAIIFHYFSLKNGSFCGRLKLSIYTFTMKELQSPQLISHDTVVGDWTFIGAGTAITKSVIGRYCSIATNCSIGMGEHLIDTVSTSVHFYPKDRARDILVQKDLSIGNDVWIAVDTIVRRGVKIGDGAIIG